MGAMRLTVNAVQDDRYLNFKTHIRPCIFQKLAAIIYLENVFVCLRCKNWFYLKLALYCSL